MSKKLLWLLVPLLLAPAIYFGATKFFLPKDQPTVNATGTLKLWGLWENADMSAFLFERFKNIYPNVKIEYEERNLGGLAEYKDLVFTRLLEGTTPDVILVHASWIPEMLSYLTPAPESVFMVNSFSQEVYPSVSRVCVLGGLVVCAAPSFDDLALVYNKEMFLGSGLMEAPKTWDDFRFFAKKLTVHDDSGKIILAGAAIGATKNVAYASDILGLMLLQNNIKIPEGLDSKEAQDVLAYYSDFVKVDKVWDGTQQNSLEALAQGKVAMVFAPSRALLGVLNSVSNVDLAVAPVPQIPNPDGKTLTNKNWASFWVFVVPLSSQNSKVAWDFIKYVTSKEELLQQYEAQSLYRVFGQILPLKELSETIGKNEYLAPYILGAENAEVSLLSAGSGNDPYVTAINSAIDEVLLGKTAQDALTSAKTTLTTLLTTKRKKR
ncbi:extracellular solute-binding protein [Candidatus Parcubacteria bacterium]|nr:extracellular solute-binding protein [Patescibacteria group bacterium]MBU4381046.1 extracellular solute-binding protein [Patescibacteria group bacterium]MCG2689051.1 extracellular solute-binding protein [Candidatus Parcubacteria bacterium]